LALAEADAGRYADMVGVALRGIGYSMIELGDFAGARAAYERSLEVEPGNQIALKELEYIAGKEQGP